ncbi:MAG: hypothetical protein ACE14L_09050 [Terriglobales bacterium]
MTISYRSVITVVALVLLIAGIVFYRLFPNSLPVRLVTSAVNYVFEKVGIGPLGGPTAAVGPQQAHFTALDGTVRVKKASSSTWVTADFNLPLERGDVVQTSSEGMAKVFFPDGTSYTVRPDSLIVIEENSANAQQQTQVAVQVTTGTVDLSTATFQQGSSSQVIVAGAKASLAPESAAMVHNDPRADVREILAKKGSVKVTRNNETVTLSDYERVTFKADSPQMTRTKEIGPPTLITPANMMPVYVTAPGKAVDFSWAPAANSHGYRLRISRNPYFSSTVLDRVIQGTDTRITGLKEGTYYWVVTSQDAGGHESVESERNQFSVVVRSPDEMTLALELDPFVQHGHVIEVKGRTDATARVMVNGQEVPLVKPDGTFSYFTPPLPTGENTITVTAHNARGAVQTRQKKVVIE